MFCELLDIKTDLYLFQNFVQKLYQNLAEYSKLCQQLKAITNVQTFLLFKLAMRLMISNKHLQSHSETLKSQGFPPEGQTSKEL